MITKPQPIDVVEMLPCPFCGSEAREKPFFFGLMQQVECQCGAKVLADTQVEATALWNTRPAERLTAPLEGDVVERVARGECPVCFGEGKDRYDEDCSYCAGTGNISVSEARIVKSAKFLREVSNPAIRLNLARAAIAALSQVSSDLSGLG